jgi:hypothetical protein
VLRPGSRYKIVSLLPDDGPARLAMSGTSYPKKVLEAYTQTHSLDDSPARRLAERITRKCTNPYEKAIAIESYLSRAYVYDTEAPAAPYSADAVEYFLFDAKRGYCVAFASAMVIMLRHVGVPARLATGFVNGTYDPLSRNYRVRERDLHAWAEVYFPNCGWVAFDPSGSEEERAIPFSELLVREMRNRLRGLFTERRGFGLLAALALMGLYLARPDLASRRIRVIAGRRTDADRGRRAALALYRSTCRLVARRLPAPRPDQTPSEYAELVRRARRLSSEACALIREITSDFEAVRYGGVDPDRHLLAAMRRNVRFLKRSIRGRQTPR